MSPSGSLHSSMVDFDPDINQNQNQNQGQGYSYTPPSQNNGYMNPIPNTPAQSQTFASPSQTQWGFHSSHQGSTTETGAQGSGSQPYGGQVYGTLSNPSQMIISDGYGYQPYYSPPHHLSQFQPTAPDTPPFVSTPAPGASAILNVPAPGVLSQQRQTTIAQVPSNMPIVKHRGKYYVLTCALCLDRKFTSIQGLFVHVKQSNSFHSSLLASDHSWAGALKAVATQVIDGNEHNVASHNQVRAICRFRGFC